MVFLYVPSYMGYQYTKNYETNELPAITQILSQVADPANTLVVSMDAYRYGFREAGYYSPEYLVVQHPEMELFSDTKVYAMQGRKTVIMDKIPIEKYSGFVTYPVPENSYTYKRIHEDMTRVFPDGAVSTLSINGYTLIQGPVSELDFLFPETAGE
jgi:hypothetical protein